MYNPTVQPKKVAKTPAKQSKQIPKQLFVKKSNSIANGPDHSYMKPTISQKIKIQTASPTKKVREDPSPLTKQQVETPASTLTNHFDFQAMKQRFSISVMPDPQPPSLKEPKRLKKPIQTYQTIQTSTSRSITQKEALKSISIYKK
jgi:hypothetical protein